MRNAYSSRIPLMKLAITTTHMSTQQIKYSQLTVILNRRLTSFALQSGLPLCDAFLRTNIIIPSSVDGVAEAQLTGLAENVIRVDVAD